MLIQTKYTLRLQVWRSTSRTFSPSYLEVTLTYINVAKKQQQKKNKEKNKDKNIADKKKKNNLTKQLTDVFVLAWEHLLFSGH